MNSPSLHVIKHPQTSLLIFLGQLADSLNIDNEAVGIIEDLLLAESDDELDLHSESEDSDTSLDYTSEDEEEGIIVADSGEQYGLYPPRDASTQTTDSGYQSLNEEYPMGSPEPVFDTTPEVSPIHAPPRLMRLNATPSSSAMLIDIPDDVSLGTLFEGMIEPQNQDYVVLEELVTATPSTSAMITPPVTPPRNINRPQKSKKPRCARRIFPSKNCQPFFI